MDELQVIERRIDNFRSVQEIVKAMRALSAQVLRQATDSLQELRAYEESLSTVLASLPIPTFRVVPATSTVCVVFGSDQGLVGALTKEVVERALRIQPRWFYAVGYRTRAELEKRGLPIAGFRPAASSVRALGDLIGEVAHAVQRMLVDGSAGGATAVYPRHESTKLYQLQSIQLFPPELPSGAERPFYRSYESSNRISRRLIEEKLYTGLYRIALEGLASEQNARLRTTVAASRVIERSLADLEIDHHRARQDQVTIEVQEVICASHAAHRN